MGNKSKVLGYFLALVPTLIIGGILYYLFLPALNLQSAWFWIFTLVILAVYWVSALIFAEGKRDHVSRGMSVVGGIIGLIFVVFLILALASAPLFLSAKYASLIEVEERDFASDIPEAENISDIALMDTESARIFGNRTVGALSDVVSQYEVDEAYSQIDLNGVPMKVSPLRYAGFFKYMNNKKNGIPGYVKVNPVTSEAAYVRLDTPLYYSEAAYFSKDLMRALRFAYPTAIFKDVYFELDNDNRPYYICPVYESRAGLFGAKDVTAVVIFNPCDGSSEYYEIGSIPQWVDRVYDGDLLAKKYDWYGIYSGGFINSVFGNVGCKQTTDDYGYKVMDGDVWVFTGVTSVSSDESNIGFVLMNSRTSEVRYYAVPGAEEYSAMAAAEGEVQHLSYVASFPSLVNIAGTPTYIMVLKDNGGLVKMYAMVNVEKYNIVVTGTTQKEALQAYKKLLRENGVMEAESQRDEILSKRITIAQIRFLTVEGDTYAYLTSMEGEVFRQLFSEQEELILLQEGDVITVYYEPTENAVYRLLDWSKE